MNEYYLCTLVHDYITSLDNLEEPSIAFLKRGVFNFNFNGLIKKIRIYCCYEEFLHIKGIYIFKDDDLLNIDEKDYRIYHGKLFNRIFSFKFNKIFEPYMLHTISDVDNNFLEIDFRELLDANKIVIYTRNENEKVAIRASALCIEIYGDNNDELYRYSYHNKLKTY